MKINPVFRTFAFSFMLLSSCTISVPASQPQSNSIYMDQKPRLIEIAQSLRRFEILSEQDYQAVMHEINQGKIFDRANLLAAMSLRLQPDHATDYVFIGKLGEQGINHLNTIAQRLKESGAISDRVYQKLQRKIGKEILLDLQLFNFAADWMSGDDDLEASKIRPFLDDLQQLGLIAKDNREKLLLDLETGKLEDKYDIPRYLENIKILNLRDYSRDPKIHLPQMHHEVAQLITKVGAADLNTATFKFQPLADIDKNVLMSMDINSKTYEFASYVSEPQSNFPGRIDADFVQLFNNMLRDQKSSYRIYTLGFFGDFGFDSSRLAVLTLTEKQATRLQKWVNSYLPIGLEDHSSAFNSDRIDSILNTIEEIGLLSHLTPQQIAAGKQKISRQSINSSYELFAAFDNLLIAFDWETGNLENPYQALTQRFAAASRGAFQPTQISNEFDYDKQSAGQSFVVKGVRYSTKLKFDGDWLDPAFIDFLDRAIAKTVSGAKFYRLYDGLSLEGYLFLSNRQRQVLESENLVQLKPEKNQN